MAGVGVLFVFLGDAMPKTRPNFFVGVRTPWTLSSDLAWQKTHRLAGWLFVLVGFWAIVAAFTLKGIALAFSVTGPILIVAAVSAVYSWFVWKADPAKRQSMRDGAR
ncbi:MAG: SdpI family protein [Hyphomonadaceae bacterium]|nr:SdpI family protein [Hyphomonadaceae bacterium]